MTSAEEAAARKAIELDPGSAAAYYNLGLLLSDDPARASEAKAVLEKATALDPSNPRYFYRLGLILHENLHSFAEAENAYRRAIALAPDNPYYYGGFISLLVQQSRRAEVVEQSITMRASLHASENWYGMAALDAILGNVDAAFDALEKAAAAPNFNRQWARKDPDLALIRSDPRFETIVGKMES